jgi:alpha-galactosidase
MAANSVANGVENDSQAFESLSKNNGELLLENGPWLLIQVALQDQSDNHAEFLWERQWLLHPSEKLLELSGCLFCAERPLDGQGRIFVKRAPLPHARPGQPAAWDFRAAAAGKDFKIDLSEPSLWSVLEYRGGPLGRAEAFQAWQRSSRPQTASHKFPKLLCNTWGDRSRDSRIQEDFILKEIEAAKRLGAEVVQIDDGWQKGRSSNSFEAQRKGGVWEGFWNSDPSFWEPDPQRFPRGLEPVSAAAKAAGVELGLWFAPDSWNDFQNWRKDAARLLELHRVFGICHFKIDGVNARSQAAFENLDSFFKALAEGSKGEIVLDLDITAQLRPGHFGAPEAGPLFVENRYTDWRSYWPHQTLRALWTLSRWVDPLRLRMEFLNRVRNQDKYEGEPLGPANYPPATLFATTMLSNPLGWFEISNLPEDYFQTVAPLVRLWKERKTELFSGAILPIGEAPDGVAWTGFLAVSPGRRRAFALLFRELNEEGDGFFRLPAGLAAGSWTWKLLAGEGSVSAHGSGLRASIPGKLGFVFCEGACD